MTEFHPLADIFPLLEGEEFTALVEDIALHGLREPIWIYADAILDGRNRWRACDRLGIECPHRTYEGDDPIGFVVSMNLRRRHLDESQRAMVATRLANLPRGANQHVEIPTTSQGQAATLLNVSRDTVIKARKIQTETAPEVIKAVDTGEMSITAALPLTDIPKDEQPAILEEMRQTLTGKKPTATQTRAAVSRVQVVATVKEQLAAGKNAQQAVSHALQQHEIILPTPALADAIAAATDRQVTLAATDGLLHDGRTKADEAAAMAETKRLFQLFNSLESLATLEDIARLVTDIPPYSAYRVEEHLDQAYTNLTTFRTLWKGVSRG